MRLRMEKIAIHGCFGATHPPPREKLACRSSGYAGTALAVDVALVMEDLPEGFTSTATVFKADKPKTAGSCGPSLGVLERVAVQY